MKIRNCFLVGVLSWAFLAGLAEAQVTQPLTGAQVNCNARQLRALLARSGARLTEAVSLEDDKVVDITLTYGRGGRFKGVAFSEQFNSDLGNLASTPEHQLWFDLVVTRVEEDALLLLLARDEEDSDLVESGAPDSFDLRFSLIPQVNLEDLGITLRINNREFNGTEAEAAEALGPFAPCHDRFTPADLRVFSVLANVVRGRSNLSHPNFQLDNSHIAIYRGQSARPIRGGMRTTYRIDVFPGDFSGSTVLAAEAVIDVYDDGRLGRAKLWPLKACRNPGQLHCTSVSTFTGFSIIKPVPPGEFWERTVASCNERTGCTGAFSFSNLLAGASLRNVN